MSTPRTQKTPPRASTDPDRARPARRPTAPDAGMATAEYALGTLVACTFAVILYKVITSGFVTDLLKDLVHKALTMVS
jgi:hypothetical protein